ncbi:hypothetical protein SEMRO_2185_G318130.1 [Seminavis robusta]|uniref:Uncharacterized protein n=1 Tax=Seminavis robusta TaxID=568900 RepID=A0A9N8HXD5_9STRA|nr:hypothetical protein SEMRO_2185_G318130.1 [Seminavis robusta]|eukprot:Sro2185_g318130.1 n/a (622) ;mRNA; f:5748-7798
MEQKIIQIRSNDGAVVKRALINSEGLSRWLQELSEEHDLEPGVKYKYLLDADCVGHDEYGTLKAEVIYSLPPVRKKQKTTSSTIAELINVKNFDAAFSKLEETSVQFRENDMEAENDICSPVKIHDTWMGHEEILKQDLRDTCAKLRLNIEMQPEGNRTARVSISQIPCQRDWFSSALSGSQYAPAICRTTAGKIDNSVLIGVDEVMELKNVGTIHQIASLAGEIAAECFQENKHQQVSFFITSLRIAAFSTSSGRPVIPFDPPIADESAVEVVLREYLHGRDMEKCKALVISAAGFHFRSMVFAAQVIAKELDPKVPSVLSEVFQRWKVRVGGFEDLCENIRDYVSDCCKGVSRGSQPEKRMSNLEDFLDRTGALPPPLICCAFGVISDDQTGVGSRMIDRKHPLFGLFNCEFAFMDPAKHLEQFGTFYDLFRSSIRLPVLSGKQEVVVPRKASKHATDWFHKLEYPKGMTISTESILEVCARKPVLTKEGKKLSEGKYYAPSARQHPLIDRAFVASYGRDQAVVLIQDKLSKDEPKAVKDLNAAANLIRAQNTEMEVLCIVNIIGAGAATTAQDSLEHPYTLVREDELDGFYSVNFSGVARFARQRKELANSQEGECSG